MRDDINNSLSQILNSKPPTKPTPSSAAPMMDELDSAMMMPVETQKQQTVPGGALEGKRKSLGREQFEKMVMHAGKMPSMIHPSTSQVMDNT